MMAHGGVDVAKLPAGQKTVGMGCREFARTIGASYPEVSRAAAAGLIRVVGTRRNSNGTTVNILDPGQAKNIAAAVACGIPWRVAATLGDRLKIIKSGGVRVQRPPDGTASSDSATRGANRILHRSHRKS